MGKELLLRLDRSLRGGRYREEISRSAIYDLERLDPAGVIPIAILAETEYSRLRFMVTRDGANMQRTIDEHVQITERIRSGSTKGVNELVFRHLNNIYNFLRRKDPANADMFTGEQF